MTLYGINIDLVPVKRQNDLSILFYRKNQWIMQLRHVRLTKHWLSGILYSFGWHLQIKPLHMFSWHFCTKNRWFEDLPVFFLYLCKCTYHITPFFPVLCKMITLNLLCVEALLYNQNGMHVCLKYYMENGKWQEGHRRGRRRHFFFSRTRSNTFTFTTLNSWSCTISCLINKWQY